MTTPQPQTPGDRREDHAEAAAAIIAAIYARIEQHLIAAAASLARKIATRTMTRTVAARQLQRTADAVFTAAAPRVRAVLDDAAAQAADSAAQAAEAAHEAAATPLPATPRPLPPAPADTRPYTQPLARSLDDAADKATGALQDTLTAVADAADKAAEPLPTVPLRAVPSAPRAAGTPSPRLALPAAPERRALPAAPRQPTIFERAISSAIGDTRGGAPYSSLSLSRIQAAQKALDDLTGQGITGFTDKAGRNWDLVSYVEMATRTAVSNSWDDMQHAAMLRAGIDLAVIGTHSTEGSCPRCLPWLGRTISLSGATAGYPTYGEARAAGWRHPNCRCFDVPLGAGIAPEVTNPIAIGQAAEVYKASQEQRALERKVRAAGRRASAAITPQARTKARRELAAARAASAEHRQRTGLRMMKVSVQRREHPARAH